MIFMEPNPKIRVDFQNADRKGRIRLNTKGSIEDIKNQKISLETGTEVFLYDEELSVNGIITFSSEENLWVATIDWDELSKSNQSD